MNNMRYFKVRNNEAFEIDYQTYRDLLERDDGSVDRLISFHSKTFDSTSALVSSDSRVIYTVGLGHSGKESDTIEAIVETPISDTMKQTAIRMAVCDMGLTHKKMDKVCDAVWGFVKGKAESLYWHFDSKGNSDYVERSKDWAMREIGYFLFSLIK